MTVSAAGLTLLRVVPVDGVLHRLDPRTKIAALVVVILALSFRPSWWALAIVAGLVIGSAAIGRIPWSARPRPPRIFAIGIGISLVLAVLAGGTPVVAVGQFEIGVGGLLAQLRFLALTIEILALTHLVGWTTSMTRLPAAAAWFLRPLGRVGVPVDELATALALSVRALPILLEEMSTAVMLWRRRPRVDAGNSRALARRSAVELVDLAGTVVASTVRRAVDIGETLERRGLDRPRPAGSFGVSDAVAALVVVALVTAVALLSA